MRIEDTDTDKRKININGISFIDKKINKFILEKLINEINSIKKRMEDREEWKTKIQ